MEKCLRSRLKRRTSRFLRTRENPSWSPSGPPESLGIKEMGKTAPIKAVGCIIASGQEIKKEILV
jgi:hypothetical protein